METLIGPAQSRTLDSELLKLVFVTDIVTPYMSAVFEALDSVSRLEVFFCAETGSRGAEWETGELPFRYRVLDGVTVDKGVDRTAYYLSPRIIPALAGVRPDGIICAGFSFPTLYAAAYARVAGSALVIHSDGTADSEQGISRTQRVARSVLLRAAGAVVANSQAAEERFRELGVPQERVFRANHTTRMEPFWRVGKERSEPAPGPLRLISVGRLIERKGLDGLFEAMLLARADGAELTLDIVGSGPEEERLGGHARELGLEVRFHGFVDQSGLPALYAASDVFAFPTLHDPFGIVVIEAAASGLPVLGSVHAGATPELVRDGVTGYAVDPRYAREMADRLVELASDRANVLAMGQAAHAETLSRTPAAAAAGYLAAVRAARG